jgi:polar amino acid transport system permease protein
LTLLDAVIVVLLAAAAVYLFYRIKVGLHYKWNWSVIPQYLFRVKEETGRLVPNLLIQGFFTTIKLSIWASLFALIIGLVMGLFRVSRVLFFKMVGRAYVELARNIPPLVLIFIFYFFISSQITTAIGLDYFIATRPDHVKRAITFLFAPPVRFSSFLSAIVALGIYEGAYMTEIIRSGIQAVDTGQWEAAYALGLSPLRRMQKVILPQAVKKILPPLAGQFISTIKDSAIVSVISIQELTFQGMELMAATYLTFEVWITITALYFGLTFSCSVAVQRLEARLRYVDY